MNEYLKFIRLPNASVTIFMDLMALIVITGILLLSEHLNSSKLQARLFKALCLSVITNLLIELVVHAVPPEKSLFYSVLLVVVASLSRTLDLFVMFTWMLYADAMLFNSKDHLVRKYRYYLVVAIIFSVAYMALFAGGFFSGFKPAIYSLVNLLYYLIQILELVYLIVPAIVIYRYKKQTGKLVMFKIAPLIIPIFICEILTEWAMFSIEPLGFAIGITSIFFSMIDVWKYESDKQGFFNIEYLNKVKEYAASGIKRYSSVILMSADENHSQIPVIIKASTPKGVELIYMESGTYIGFLQTADRLHLDLVSRMINDDIDKYNIEHPDTMINSTPIILTRKKDENVSVFVNRIINSIG